MRALHSNPIETSSPEVVVSPLCQASYRSDVRKKVPVGVLSPFAFSVCDLPCGIAGTPTTTRPRTLALPQRTLIANHSITSHPPGPIGDKTPPAPFAPVYSRTATLRQILSALVGSC